MSCHNNCGNERRRNSLFCSDKCGFDYFYEHNRRKSKAFWKTHKEIVKWGNDYIVEKFAGTLLEITYEQYKGDIYEMRKSGDIVIPKDEVKDFIKNIGKILWLYFIQSEIYLPMTIKVDDDGKCHLLMFNSNTGIHTTNKILRHGEVEIVDKNYKHPW